MSDTRPMPEFGTILAELGEDHVLTVTLNRPERLNSFNQQSLEDFTALWRYAAATGEVHVIVLKAAGDRAFCTGVDVVDGINRKQGDPYNETDPGFALSPKHNRCWKPLICAVHGMAAGGALYWLNEADIIVASEDATFFDPHTTYGMVAALEPIGLARRIPLGEVLRMVLLGNDERMSARRALEIGFVSEVVPRDRLHERAHELAQRIAEKPTMAVQGSLKAIWESLNATRSQALDAGLGYVQLAEANGTKRGDTPTAKGRRYEVR
ncbi:MAG TPA: enoyl-CoA hydratase/isomerase family protein [Trebonia sp.]|jgi:enoyl-CoA hydratase/carnithine racemase